MKKSGYFYLLPVLLLVVFNGPYYLSAAERVLETKTLDRFYDPIEIRCELFPGLIDLELDRLALVSAQADKLKIIPYQFDEWTPKGDLILKLGVENNAAEANGKLDPQDMLVFMARDLGDRVAPEVWRQLGDVGAEIEVTDPLNNKKGWAYLVLFSQKIPPDTQKYLLRVETETTDLRLYGATFTVDGMSRTIGKKHYRTYINKHIWVNENAGGNGKDLIDRSKLRASVNILFGLIEINMDEDRVIGEIARYFVGPVRGMAYQWHSIMLPMNLKSPRIYGSCYMYDTMVIIPVKVNFPFNPGYVITNCVLHIGYDLNEPNGRGLKYYSDTNPQGFLMDGRMDDKELTEYNDAIDSWRCVVGPQGWIVHRSLWDEDFRSQANIKMFYIDDVDHHSPPDYYPGDLGHYYTESTIESLEARDYFLQLELYWPYNLYTPGGLDIEKIVAVCNVRDNPLSIKIGTKQVVNTGAFLTPMTP